MKTVEILQRSQTEVIMQIGSYPLRSRRLTVRGATPSDKWQSEFERPLVAITP